MDAYESIMDLAEHYLRILMDNKVNDECVSAIVKMLGNNILNVKTLMMYEAILDEIADRHKNIIK